MNSRRPMDRVATVPNLLTISRIVLAPVFLVLYARGETSCALVVFAVAAVTDVVDGLAARLLDQRSHLGAFLDPIADKLLAACALVALYTRGLLPLWLPLLVLSRDLALFSGAAVLHTLGRPTPLPPTRIGKYATFSLATVVVLALLWETRPGWLPGDLATYVAAAAVIAAECVVISWVQYGLAFVESVRAQRSGPARSPIP